MRGSISYAAQSAFIINASIKQNILFGAAYDERRYLAVRAPASTLLSDQLLSAFSTTPYPCAQAVCR